MSKYLVLLIMAWVILTAPFYALAEECDRDDGCYGSTGKYYLTVLKTKNQPNPSTGLYTVRVKIEQGVVSPKPNNRRILYYALVATAIEPGQFTRRAVDVYKFKNCRQVVQVLNRWPHYVNRFGKTVYLPIGYDEMMWTLKGRE